MFNKKKSHFEKMKRDATVVLWETEFQKFTVLELREQTRKQYDQAQQALEAILTRLKVSPEDKNLQEQKLMMEKTISNFKDKLIAIGTRLEGGQPCALIPDGVPVGMTEDLQNKANRIGMIEWFIKNNC